MTVRDAVERDAPAMAALSDAPEPVLRDVIHERSVRVLVGDDGSVAGNDEPGAPPDEREADLTGFVSFDAREDTVFVTQFGGDSDACERLLAEPIAFARGAGLPVEVLLREGDDAMRRAVEAVGFDPGGRPTVPRGADSALPLRAGVG
ncbi:hypothetical protein SY89_00042 [Halolamina pelagica]|uniref:N-acetyltransferase domain-containing protein n=1 Tax=Halolamina pelagica TaxID=699431 RepID=A0A0P7HY69_9EURY|nr:hypothetical protein [Halolamina pelagica]KPN29329.1 hypothetical protein SY89_00042 [Halolamina pelagica]